MSASRVITRAHGGGGSASAELMAKYFLNAYGNDVLNQLGDQAIVSISCPRIAFTTDSYVVDPVFFPGGNIGNLAVYGTVNDLAMCGARPKYLSLGFILVEGFPLEKLEIINRSIAEAAKKSNVEIVTGDTKVIAGTGIDQVFINSSGIGEVPAGIDIHPKRVQPGDKIILNGTIGDHGIAVLTSRKEFSFECSLKSDSAPLYDLVKAMLEIEADIKMMRDPTRGGLASTLNEIAQGSNTGIVIYEEAIPILEEVKSVCEILGLDPLHVANEGKLVAFVPEHSADKILDVMKVLPEGKDASIIGEVVKTEQPGIVEMKTVFPGSRIVEMMVGDQLPRIC